jgi:hypothetical protein
VELYYSLALVLYVKLSRIGGRIRIYFEFASVIPLVLYRESYLSRLETSWKDTVWWVV